MQLPEMHKISVDNQLIYEGMNITFNGEEIDYTGEGAQFKIFMRTNNPKENGPYFVCSVPLTEIAKFIPTIEKLV